MWTADDQDVAIAYERRLSSACPNCGTRKDDWLDPETGGFLDPPLVEPYIARCPGCEESQRLWKTVSEDRRSGARIAIRFFDPNKPYDEALMEPAALIDGEGQ